MDKLKSSSICFLQVLAQKSDNIRKQLSNVSNVGLSAKHQATVLFLWGFFCHNELLEWNSAHISHVGLLFYSCQVLFKRSKMLHILFIFFSFMAKFNLAVNPSSPSLHTVSMLSWRIWQWAALGTVNTTCQCFYQHITGEDKLHLSHSLMKISGWFLIYPPPPPHVTWNAIREMWMCFM